MGTALIVEDDPDQADLASILVSRRGLEPLVAGTGEAGLAWPRRARPSVVLLDLMLPDLDGFDVCRQLRGDRATMTMPVVMLTALDDAVHRRRGFRVGANAYLTKPYEPEDLYAAI